MGNHGLSLFEAKGMRVLYALCLLLASWSFCASVAYEISQPESVKLVYGQRTTFSVTVDNPEDRPFIKFGCDQFSITCARPVDEDRYDLYDLRNCEINNSEFVLEVQLRGVCAYNTIPVRLLRGPRDEEPLATANWQIARWFMTSNAHKALKVFYPVDQTADIFRPAMPYRLSHPVPVTHDHERYLQDYVEFGYQAGGDDFHAAAINFKPQDVTDTMRVAAGATDLQVVPRSGVINTSNMGGNLEVTPPYPDYPRGRIVYGTTRSHPFPRALRAFLNEQDLQTPLIAVDVDGLKVGHVDEVLSFVPLVSASRYGHHFKVLFPSIHAGLLTIWENRDKPFLRPPRFMVPQERRGFASLFWALGVQRCQATGDDEYPLCNPFQITGEEVINALLVEQDDFESGYHIVLTKGAKQIPYKYKIREWAQLDKMFKQAEATMKKELGGVMESIHIPILMHNQKAMFPNMVNHLVFVDESDRVQHVVPHSYITGFNEAFVNLVRRSDSQSRSNRRVIRFVDDYKLYHAGDGDTHCATNAKRSPNVYLQP